MKKRFKFSDFYFRNNETLRTWVYIPFLNLVISVFLVLPMFLTLIPVMVSIAICDAVGDCEDNK